MLRMPTEFRHVKNAPETRLRASDVLWGTATVDLLKLSESARGYTFIFVQQVLRSMPFGKTSVCSSNVLKLQFVRWCQCLTQTRP